ncbi:hypothetical protein MHYP_G00310320 [Metynnis hypsauchen]
MRKNRVWCAYVSQLNCTAQLSNVILFHCLTAATKATPDGCVNLVKAASVVKKNSGTLIPLVKPKSYHVRVCRQDDTVYAGNEDQLDAWEDHYLPERMAMEVIGAIDDFPCEAYDRQLVLLLCEDGNIYAYEDEVLHLVARSLRDLFESGMTFPGIKSFNLGECFEDYEELQMWSDIEVVENVKTSETTCLDIVVRKSMIQTHRNIMELLFAAGKELRSQF